MEKKFKLGVIGAGFMAQAIVRGVLNAKILKSEEIMVSDLSDDALLNMAKLGVNTTSDSLELANCCEFILFAVKPQNSQAVFELVKNSGCEKLISIMAGVSIEKIIKSTGKSLVARCMPNTPCSLGFGAIGLDLTRYIDDLDKEFIKKLFSAVGLVVCLDESLLNAVTGISGSAPAYFYLFLKSIIQAGVKKGLNQEDAKKLATATMLGSAKMVIENNKSLDELINAVCSKGGTTIEAVKVFENNNIDDIVDQAVTACVNRAEELERL